MLVSVYLALILVGSGASYLSMVAKRAPVFTSIASAGVWSVVGYAGTSLDTVANDGTINSAAAAEPAVSALAFGTAILSLIVTLAAAKGDFADNGIAPPTRSEMEP